MGKRVGGFRHLGRGGELRRLDSTTMTFERQHTTSTRPSPCKGAAGARQSKRKCVCGAVPDLDDGCEECRAGKLRRGEKSTPTPRVPAFLDRHRPAPGGDARTRPMRGHDFGRLRVHAGVGAARHELRRACGTRVPVGNVKAAGPGQHRLLGFAVCSTGTGKYVPVVRQEFCLGNCIERHEQVHVEDMSPCCQNYAACFNSNGMAGSARCREVWERYEARTEHWSECNANIDGFECLWSLLMDCCLFDSEEKGDECGDKETRGECCEELDKQHAFVTEMVIYHCPRSVPFPCPFTEDGEILPGL